MKKIAVLGAALAASVMTAPVALAQDGPVLTASATQACGRVTLTAEVHRNLLGKNDAYEIAVSAGAEGEVTAEIGRFTVDFVGGAVSKTFTFEEDAHGGKALVAWNTVQGPERDVFVSGAVEVDTDCSDEPVEPTPTATPEPTEAPDPADIDCGDFPLADGRTAQEVLDADQADPHQLDEDGDLVACEADDPAANLTPTATPAPADDTDGRPSSDVVVPRGGVSTGGGPA